MGTYLPRQLVQEKLNELGESIPEKFGSPSMGPISTGLGQIYEYTIKPEEGFENKYSPMELRTVQDWVIKRQLTLLEGVVEVNSYGGSIKQYEVTVNPDKLNSLDQNWHFFVCHHHCCMPPCAPVNHMEYDVLLVEEQICLNLFVELSRNRCCGNVLW